MATFHEDWYSNDQCSNVAYLIKQTTQLTGMNIEIGCWEGKSTIALANACYPEIIYCNDTWEGNVAEAQVAGYEEHPTTTILKTRDVYKTFQDNMTTETKGNYVIVKRDCLAWLPEIKEPIKFAHIDASHDYYSVKNTIVALLPNLVRGGILCGDDFLNAHAGCDYLAGGVERAVRELLPGALNAGNLWYWVKQE